MPSSDLSPAPLAEPAPASRPASLPETAPAVQGWENLRPCWQDLRARLARDGLSGPKVDAMLATLGPLTQSPMGRKMREMYNNRFFPKPKPTKPSDLYYRGVVTEASAKQCRAFIAQHKAAFEKARATYAMPPSVACALLFVETRLGTQLADVRENAFQILASMAESRKVEDIPDWLAKLPGWENHPDFFAEAMPRKADWAYNETKALVKHMLATGLTPDRYPSSIYGAVGLCQFMPSNIPLYGADGTGDSICDLFLVPDAIMSLSNYLAAHGWKSTLTAAQKHKVIRTYNHSDRYAASILALADVIDGKPVPTDAPKAAAAPRPKPSTSKAASGTRRMKAAPKPSAKPQTGGRAAQRSSSRSASGAR